jgi:hypothetical protein
MSSSCQCGCATLHRSTDPSILQVQKGLNKGSGSCQGVLLAGAFNYGSESMHLVFALNYRAQKEYAMIRDVVISRRYHRYDFKYRLALDPMIALASRCSFVEYATPSLPRGALYLKVLNHLTRHYNSPFVRQKKAWTDDQPKLAISESNPVIAAALAPKRLPVQSRTSCWTKLNVLSRQTN